MKSANIKEMELIIKFHQEGKSSYDIAGILDISQTKASFWIRRYRETKSLENLPRSGRPTPLTNESLNSIAKAIELQIVNPRGRLGISSKEVLSLIESKIKRRYTLRHAERLLHKMGFSLITPRVNHIRKDEHAQEKFRGMFKKNSIRSIWGIQS